MEEYATCARCGCQFPLDLITAHILEEHPDLTRQEIADAPIMLTCPTCGGSGTVTWESVTVGGAITSVCGACAGAGMVEESDADG